MLLGHSLSTWVFSFLYMEIINNVNKTLKDDMLVTLRSGSKVAIAASCFSIYAFQELKEQLSDISELRFIFTSPSFVTEKADKQKREFSLNGLNLDVVWQNTLLLSVNWRLPRATLSPNKSALTRNVQDSCVRLNRWNAKCDPPLNLAVNANSILKSRN